MDSDKANRLHNSYGMLLLLKFQRLLTFFMTGEKEALIKLIKRAIKVARKFFFHKNYTLTSRIVGKGGKKGIPTPTRPETHFVADFVAMNCRRHRLPFF